MYKVKVIKKGKIILGDLNLTLTHGQIIDLEDMRPRAALDQSYNLACATSGDNPPLAILHKDVYVERPVPTHDPQHLAAMEERIKLTLLQAMQSQQPQAQPAAHHDLGNQLAQVLTALQNQTNKTSGSTETVIDDDKAVDIQMRAVQRLTHNTTGHVQSSEQVKDSDAAKRAKELGDMDF